MVSLTGTYLSAGTRQELGQSLEYGFLITLLSPIGPVISVFTAERWQRRLIIVLLAMLMAGSGLAFPFASGAWSMVGIGGLLTVFSYWFSAVVHAYQAELFPTRVRATGVGFTYSWSRLSAVFSTLSIGALVTKGFSPCLFLWRSLWVGVVLTVGLFGRKTNSLALEEVSF